MTYSRLCLGAALALAGCHGGALDLDAIGSRLQRLTTGSSAFFSSGSQIDETSNAISPTRVLIPPAGPFAGYAYAASQHASDFANQNRFSRIKRYKLNPLPNDPDATWLALVGGIHFQAMAVDTQGCMYLAGTTGPGILHNPTTPGAPQTSTTGNNVVVLVLNAQGTVVFGTYLGGGTTNTYDSARDIEVTANGNDIFIAGESTSTLFPAFAPFPKLPNPNPNGNTDIVRGNDAFLARLTRLGGDCTAPTAGDAQLQYAVTGARFVGDVNDVALDANGALHVTGGATSALPTTASAFQPQSGGGGGDAYLMVLQPTQGPLPPTPPAPPPSPGVTVAHASFLGGNNVEEGTGVATRCEAVDPQTGICTLVGSYVSGETSSRTTFPTVGGGTPGAALSNSSHAFLAKVLVSTTGPMVKIFATLYGGIDPGGSASERKPTYGPAVALDGSGNAYLAGRTTATLLPVIGPNNSIVSSPSSGVSNCPAVPPPEPPAPGSTPNVQCACQGGSDGYLARFNLALQEDQTLPPPPAAPLILAYPRLARATYVCGTRTDNLSSVALRPDNGAILATGQTASTNGADQFAPVRPITPDPWASFLVEVAP